ncbi:MAG: ligase-associated DNA damage response endonuclease PdeM [Pseudomonadota bacterium]
MILTLERAGQRLCLLPEKAVFLPDSHTLLVADMHLGKAATFCRLGVPVPQATNVESLQTLATLVVRWQVQRVVFLGDFLHAADAHDPPTQAAFLQWRHQSSHAALSLVLVRGNHDQHAGDPPGSWGVTPVDEPWFCEGLTLLHHPSAAPEEAALCLAGHEHPCVHVHGRGRDQLRLPCFHERGNVLVLPSFGAFTGMHAVTARPGHALYAVAGDRVMVV